jgi:hypothetical protein
VFAISSNIKLEMELKDRSGKVLATNHYDFSPLAAEKKKDK